MQRLRWKVALSIGLICLSALLYLAHFAIYRDAHHIFIYLLGDIAFIPIDVLLVVLVLHQIITNHEKQQMLKKLNMVFGAFFSEVGTPLMRQFLLFDTRADELKSAFRLSHESRPKEFALLRQKIKSHEIAIDVHRADLAALRELLVSKREFLLRLLENPNLLEHEDFTDLLWAVFHLAEELSARTDVSRLPEADCQHLDNDIKRAYSLLAGEWVAYMRHLHRDYPFLFSLALRTNPFNPNATVVIS